MTYSAIHHENNALATLARQAGTQVTNAVKLASAETGVDFAYLMQQAKAESSFDTDAQAATSSARGLYQFIESTWLQMVRDHGHKYGLEDYAAEIDARGRVDDPDIRQDILALRDDPKTAALMAAEFAAANKAHLEQFVDQGYGDIGATELYFAHFLGASGATGFLNALHEDPLATAADLFPKAARANRNVFYDSKTGEARTLAGVYEFFDRKFEIDAPVNESAPHDLIAQAEQPASKPSNAEIEMAALRRKQALHRILNGSPRADILQDATISRYLTQPDMAAFWHRPAAGINKPNSFHTQLLNPLSLLQLSRLDAGF